MSSSFLLHIKSLASREKSMVSSLFFSEWTGHRGLSCKDRLAWTKFNNLRQTVNNTGSICSHCGGPRGPCPAADGDRSSRLCRSARRVQKRQACAEAHAHSHRRTPPGNVPDDKMMLLMVQFVGF